MDIRKKFITACKNNNLELAESLLINGDDSDEKINIDKLYDIYDDDEDNPLVAYACAYDYIDIVKFLVENGANVNCYEDNGGYIMSTPLMHACKNNNLELVKYLVDCGAKINIELYNCIMPLRYACDNNNLEMVKYLVEHGANIDRIGYSLIEENYLSYVCSMCDIDIIKYFVNIDNENININISNKTTTPIMNIMVNKYLSNNDKLMDIAKYLIDHGANIYYKTCNSSDILICYSIYDIYSPLIYACYFHKIELIKYFIDLGVDIDEDIYYCICNISEISIIKLILEYGYKNMDNFALYTDNTEKYLRKNNRITNDEINEIIYTVIPQIKRNIAIFN